MTRTTIPAESARAPYEAPSLEALGAWSAVTTLVCSGEICEPGNGGNAVPGLARRLLGGMTDDEGLF